MPPGGTYRLRQDPSPLGCIRFLKWNAQYTGTWNAFGSAEAGHSMQVAKLNSVKSVVTLWYTIINVLPSKGHQISFNSAF